MVLMISTYLVNFPLFIFSSFINFNGVISFETFGISIASYYMYRLVKATIFSKGENKNGTLQYTITERCRK